MIKKYAVIGNPIAHSLSPFIHSSFAQEFGLCLDYHKILGLEEYFEQQVIDFFTQNGQGLSITSPYKQRAFSMSEVVTERCYQAKSANTLWMNAGKLHADNTDGVGFIRDISRFINLEAKRILVLGAGGAALGIVGLLLAVRPKALRISNRTSRHLDALKEIFPTVQYNEWNSLSGSYDVIINATSASLKDEPLLLNIDLLQEKPFCYDLAYSQTGNTDFLSWAKSHNCLAADGLGMLIEQAGEAFFIWHGMKPTTKNILEKLCYKKHIFDL